MTSTRLAGVFFVVAAATAIVALALYQPLLDDPAGYLADGARGDTSVLLGALLEFAAAVSVIGTATTLYPLLRPRGESAAISYLAGRVFEATAIIVGIMSLLAIVALRRDGSGDAAGADALVALHDWTFLFGPGLAIGINTTLLATLMRGLVPRWVPLVGLVGGPLVFCSSVAVLFGAYEQTSAVAGLAALPVFVWEMALAVCLLRGRVTA